MALQHQSTMNIYKEWKQEVGFEVDLHYVMGALSRLFL